VAASILCIGTELTRGEIVNTNAAWLSEQLTRLGFEVLQSVEVPDDPVSIGDAIRQLAERATVIVATGGLGPTTDDLTNAAVARFLGVELWRDEPGLLALRERFAKLGRTFHPSNAKQLDFPAGATPLPNEVGTAPGFSIKIGTATAYFLPGVPGEMKPMFTRSVEPALGGVARQGMHQIRLKTFGMPEARVNDLLSGIEERYRVTLGYRAHFPQIEVKVLARAATQEQALALAEPAANEVRARLGSAVFAEGDVTLAESVGLLLRERGLSLGLAESCTGGLVAQLICERPASEYFRGAVVCYANGVKSAVLGVDERVLAEKGAVSAEVVEQMAQGARRVLAADVALAITGIAGPSGGSVEKPVGLVHYAVATAAGITLRQTSMPRSRDQVRLHAAYTGLMLVRQVLLEGHMAR
jgi:nicotinamide-nucleotide amidase